MRVLFAGTPEVALPVLHALLGSSEHEVVGVLTRADAPKGRGRSLHPSPVAQVARAGGLDVRTPATLKDPQIQEWVSQLHADVAIVVAYGKLVPASLLSLPTHGWLNLHFSALPAWRGAAPVQRALIAGDDVTGACVFQLETGLDTGPILARLTHPIGARDTSGDLLSQLADAGAPLVLQALEALESGEAVFEPQDDTAATYAPTLSSSDGEVCWDEEAQVIDSLIRGVTPAPGAYTLYAGTRMRLGPVEIEAERTDLAPGQIEATKRQVLVGTATCAVRLGQVAPAGKKWMPADAWARGAHPQAEARFGQEA